MQAGFDDASRVTPAAFEAWFNEKLADVSCLQAVLESADGTPIGQVRFEQLEAGSIEADVSVDAHWRGKGVGKALLAEGMRFAKSHWPSTTKVVAKIRTENAPSERLFRGSGFAAAGAGIVDGRLYLLMERLL